MNIDLTGKAVLVTGSSRGIGRAIAEELASSGAKVAVHCRKETEQAESLSKALGNGSLAFQADLVRPEDCRRLFQEVLQAFGKIDVLVNNAGMSIITPLDEPDDVWLKNWNTVQSVNLQAPAILCREAVKHFKENGGGRIINIASRAAFRGDVPDYLAYASSKGGLVSLSRSIARGFGKDNIKSFVLAPGFVRTEMSKGVLEKYGEELATSDLALDRLTEPKDIAPMVVLLASGLADHATGSTIDVNAGSYVH